MLDSLFQEKMHLRWWVPLPHETPQGHGTMGLLLERFFPRLQKWIPLKFDEWICQNEKGVKLKIVIWGIHVELSVYGILWPLHVHVRLYHQSWALDFGEGRPVGFVLRFKGFLISGFRLASIQLRHATDVHEGINKAHRSAACVPMKVPNVIFYVLSQDKQAATKYVVTCPKSIFSKVNLVLNFTSQCNPPSLSINLPPNQPIFY